MWRLTPVLLFVLAACSTPTAPEPEPEPRVEFEARMEPTYGGCYAKLVAHNTGEVTAVLEAAWVYAGTYSESISADVMWGSYPYLEAGESTSGRFRLTVSRGREVTWSARSDGGSARVSAVCE